jgi:hypothetical protein
MAITGLLGNYAAPASPSGYSIPQYGGNATDFPTWLIQQGSRVASTPYQQYGGQRIAGISPETQQSWNMITQRAQQGDAGVNSAQSMNTNTINGQYLDPKSNPYLQQTYDQAANRMADAYARGTSSQTLAQFNRPGAFGGSAMQETQAANNQAFGDSLANLGNQIYGGNYQQERARQMQASAMAPEFAQQKYQDAAALAGVGGAKTGYDQNLLDTNYQDWLSARDYPQQQLGLLAGLGGVGTSAAKLAQDQSQIDWERQQAASKANRQQWQSALGGAFSGYQLAQQNDINPWLGAVGGGLLGYML